jgi:hypothetical protein
MSDNNDVYLAKKTYQILLQIESDESSPLKELI